MTLTGTLLGLSIIRSVRNELVIYRASVIMLGQIYQADCGSLREAFEFAQSYLDASKEQWKGGALPKLENGKPYTNPRPDGTSTI